MNNLSDTEKYQIDRQSYKFNDVPLDDPRVWKRFHEGRTKSVFQLESPLGSDWSRRIKPSSIEELADTITLIRPGGLESGQSEEYVQIKDGKKNLECKIPALYDIVKDTQGQIIYQEQVIRIGIEVAGMTGEQADTYLRKGIGKKDTKIIAEAKEIFINGAISKGTVTKEEAEDLFETIKYFQRYSFNRSHGVSYAITSYHCMYAKVHFVTEFFTASLVYSREKPSPREEIYELVQDARLHDVKILPPDLREANSDFKIKKEREIVFGLSHIRGVGKSTIESLGKLNVTSWIDFLISASQVRRDAVEGLIKSGAVDFLNTSRIDMLNQFRIVYGQSKKESKETPLQFRALTKKELPVFCEYAKDAGFLGALEYILESKTCTTPRRPVIETKIEQVKKTKKDTGVQNSAWEKIYLGLALTCSAVDDITGKDDSITCRQMYNLKNKDNFTTYCVVDSIRKRKTSEKSRNPGQEFCFMECSDNTGNINATVWPEVFADIKNDLYTDIVIKLEGYKDNWKGRENFVANKIEVIG